ncbi:alpha/beta hydrolase fold domain-containing protein [Nocardioides sp. NPDC047086]|uniref:alpha/beta hydrolase n=1 Tax=Nocardioides sp. NPDC047086 TaxID=3154810 RepID=UPI0033CBFA27
MTRTAVQVQDRGVDGLVELRRRRAALLADRRLTWVFGADEPGATVREAWAGGIRMRIHAPRAAPSSGRPIVLAFHGGGWCWGSPEQSRWMAGRIAVRTGAVVVVPACRLAPEHPYPAAVEDCWTVLVGLRGPGLGGIVGHYLGRDGSLAEEWSASPLRARSHAGLPPALVLTARFDPVRSHAERYAAALRTAGVEVAVHRPALATHAYLTLPGISPASRAGLARVVTFLRGVLASR